MLLIQCRELVGQADRDVVRLTQIRKVFAANGGVSGPLSLCLRLWRSATGTTETISQDKIKVAVQVRV